MAWWRGRYKWYRQSVYSYIHSMITVLAGGVTGPTRQCLTGWSSDDTTTSDRERFTLQRRADVDRIHHLRGTRDRVVVWGVNTSLVRVTLWRLRLITAVFASRWKRWTDSVLIVLRGVYSDTTQFNWTDPVEQRTANQREASQSCFCLWRHKRAFDLSWVQLSWVEFSCVSINTPLVALSYVRAPLTYGRRVRLSVTSVGHFPRTYSSPNIFPARHFPSSPRTSPRLIKRKFENLH